MKTTGKWNIQLVVNRAKEIAPDYECLSKNYTNNKTKLEFRCSKGHLFYMSWDNFLHDKRCSYCSGNRKKDIHYVKSYIESFGYFCLENNYIGAHSKLMVRCPNHHEYLVTWSDFQSGKRCRKCYHDRLRLDEDFVISNINDRGYTYLSGEYITASSKLRIMCPEGHIFFTIWARFGAGVGCAKCYHEKLRKDWSDEEIVEFRQYRNKVSQITNKNYTLYREVINPFEYSRSKYTYHIDHTYSVIDGFINDVLPEIIAHPNNLRMLPFNENMSKRGRSDITLTELYRIIERGKEL